MSKNTLKKAPQAIFLFLLMSVSIAFSQTDETGKLSTGVKWVYLSDEYKLCCIQTYKDASDKLPSLIKGKTSGKWCITVDMDETIASNLEYQKMLEITGKPHSSELWLNWCNSKKASAIEGAVEFNKLVKKSGGLFIVVTNRGGKEAASSIENLKEIGFECDACLFKSGKYATDETKQWRRDDIISGKVSGLPDGVKLPPLEIVMLAGDQISDLYDPVCYSLKDVTGDYMKKMIVLPNPQYGNWMDNYAAYYNRKMKIGQEICFWLKSNPTTGYSWSLSSPEDKSVVSKIDSTYQAPSKPVPGMGGVEVWKFKATGKGKAKIVLNYTRPWEKNQKPLEIREFNITVID